MATIKDRNSMDLPETEDIKKKWQEYTEELFKKDLHKPDNHNGVITHPEPDILECEVKWALESIDMNNANGGDLMLIEVMKFQLSYFKSPKDNAIMVLHSICKFGKLSSGHRT